MPHPSTLSRYRGALLGLAVCDALGTTVEFSPPGTFEPVTDIVGGGPFGLKPGEWTDDTAMALCLAESLVERQGFDAADQMQRYVRWWRHGHLSSTGRCFDIGNTVRAALSEFERTGNPLAGSTSPHSAGNGSLMRLAPVPLFFGRRPAEAVHYAAESSKTTHGATEAVDACRLMAALIVAALDGASKNDLLDAALPHRPAKLSAVIAEVANGSYKVRQPPAIQGTGYVVRSLEAALWAFHHSSSFEEGALKAVNLGDDADTTGAVYGQLAGAHYGVEAIPQRWRNVVAHRDTIEGFAARLHDAASGR